MKVLYLSHLYTFPLHILLVMASCMRESEQGRWKSIEKVGYAKRIYCFGFIIVIMLCYFLVLNTAPSKEQVRDVRWGSLLGTGTPNVLLKYRFPYKIHNYATCKVFGWATQFLCMVPYNIGKESVFQIPVSYGHLLGVSNDYLSMFMYTHPPSG